MAFLHIINSQNEDDQRMIAIERARPMFVGRLPACDISLPSPAVSRQHAVLIEKNGTFGIKDLGSVNGTFVNGKRLDGSRKIKDGDIVQVGEFILKIVREEAHATVIMPLPGDLLPGVLPPAADSTPNALVDESTSVLDAEPEPEPEITFSEELALSGTVMETPSKMASLAPGPESAVPASAGEAAPSAAASSIKPEAELAPDGKKHAAQLTVTDDEAKAVEEETAFPPHEFEHFAKPARQAVPIDEELYEPDSAFFEEDDSEDGRKLVDETDETGEPAVEEAAKKEAAVTKAAAEAGLVGEFTPDLEEEGAGQVPFQEESLFDKIPLSAGFRQAIENRLSLYSFLGDLAKERQDFLARLPQMPDAVKAELARQDRELVKTPGAALARDMIGKREARRKALQEKIAEAKINGTPPPKRPPKSMHEAEELAETQWHFIIQSEEEAIPAVFDEAYAVVKDEPLNEPLTAKGIDVKPLFGGAAYLLALESILDETTRERQEVRSGLAIISAKDDKKSGFHLFGRDDEDDEDDGDDGDDGDDEEDEGDPAPNAEDLPSRDQELADRIGWINKEMAELEKKLITEFWRVYTEAALAFIPDSAPMPLPVRCFLRHGAIGLKPWWMKEDVRDHVIEDCRDNYRDREAREAAETCIVYADEYLEAVLGGECTPALDENLELNERNSPAWKADKALRRIVYSRKQEVRLTGLLETIQEHLDRLREETESFDAKLAKILPGSRNEKQNRRELQQKQQGVRVETTKTTKIKDKIKNETLAALQETVNDTEARFASGELPRPDTEFLIRRECDAIHRIARLLANLKERFLPLVVRDYKLGTDAMNDREAVAAKVSFMEKRDPLVFLETIVPAKKRKDRVDLRISPTIVIVPSPGLLCYSWNPRGGQENGRLAIPTCFIRQRLRERQITYLFSDFRWDTSKAAAGMDIMMSDTIVAAFMAVRWDWRKRSREAREKGLIFNDQNDRTNWRRVYESYIQTALDGGKKLYNRNYDFYERIIGKYFYLPEGVELLKK